MTIHTVVKNMVCRPPTNTTLNAEYLTESTEEEMDRHRNRFDGSVGYQTMAVNRRRHRTNDEMRYCPSDRKSHPLLWRSEANPNTQRNSCDVDGQNKYPGHRIECKPLRKKL